MTSNLVEDELSKVESSILKQKNTNRFKNTGPMIAWKLVSDQEFM